MSAQLQDDRIPVTLLTGFLGAGKTTLLNHLIRDPGAGRIAVIMNELGDVGLDHDLIEAATEEIILMQSGCICCSIRGDLLTSLDALLARRDQGALDFDRIVIETTGIADPGPILHTLVVDDRTAPRYRMDGVVVLADAAAGPGTLNQQFEAVQQIAMADLIILSKTDLVTAQELAQFQTRLQSITPSAQQLCADHGQVPAGALFGLSAMRANVTTKGLSDWLGMSRDMGAAKPDPLAQLTAFAEKPQHAAPLRQTGARAALDHRISAASIEISDPIPANTFDFWLDTLIALKGPDILRVKGIVHVEDTPWPFVFHGVQHIFDAPVPLKSWSGSEMTSRVVVIARDMAQADLQASLETLRLRPNSSAPGTAGMMTHSSTPS
ncbi:MAG: GTP-binding protein [Mangrovicoccus sp.]|nr:GTP-binding protein [Mangrovicoccus sp.]